MNKDILDGNTILKNISTEELQRELKVRNSEYQEYKDETNQIAKLLGKFMNKYHSKLGKINRTQIEKTRELLKSL